MPTESKPPARRVHPLLALPLGIVGFGTMGWATVVFLNMLDGFASEPWLTLLPQLALSLGLFGVGFWLFARGAAAFLHASPPDA